MPWRKGYTAVNKGWLTETKSGFSLLKVNLDLVRSLVVKAQSRIAAFGAIAVLLLSACGGGSESSSRTKNSALCYATQEEKDAAVQAAQDAFDAAMGGGTPGDPISDTTVPAQQDTSTTVEEETSTTIEMESMGGGYRKPALRTRSADTTTPSSGEELTPEQQQAKMDMEAAEATPLCDGVNTAGAEKTCEITLNSVGEIGGTSSCEEVVVQIVNSQATAAIEWIATAGTQTVASGVWDSVSENTKVVTFTYTPQTEADSQDAGGSTVTCTGTANGEVTDLSFTDDCADGYLYGSNSVDGFTWFLVRNGSLISDGGAILASGPLDLSTLTPDTPVSFEISYEGTGGSETTDTTVAESTSACNAIFAPTGVSWECTDGTLFNVAIEDMSNPGVYPLVSCSSNGYLSVADGQKFWFNFYLINGEQTFFDGWNTDQPMNEPIPFTVPEDTEGVCTSSEDQNPDLFDVSVPGAYQFTALGYSDTRTTIGFFAPGECSNNNNFAINWYFFDGVGYEYSSTSDPETFYPEGAEGPAFCSYTDDSYYEGQWVAEFVGSTQTLSAFSNVEIVAVDPSVLEPVLPELPELPFSYTFDKPAVQYNFVLTEETRVAITANSGQSCSQYEADDEGNGFIDPELYLYSGVAPYSESNNDEIAWDDNGFHSANNCSAAYVDETLPAGSYFIWAENDDFSDGDTGTVTINSSVELVAYDVNLDEISMTTKSVTVPDAMKFQVPTGGAHFVATLDSLDSTCEVQDPAIAVINLSNGVTVTADDDSGEDYLGMNACSSFIDVNLPEGEYLLVFSTYMVMFDDYAWDEEGSGSGSTFELKYGFASESGAGDQIVVEESNDPIPPVEISQTVQVPVDQLKSGADVSVGVSEDVSTMVCSSTCIEDLFALDGVVGDALTLSVGGESVVIRKGDTKARIAVQSGSRDLVVTQTGSNGSTQVVGSTKVFTAPANYGAAASAEGSKKSGNSMQLIVFVVLGLLVIAGVGVVVRRRTAE